MKYIAFGVGVFGTALGLGAVYIQKFGLKGANVYGPWGATLAVTILGLLGATLILVNRRKMGGAVSLAASVLGVATSLELWLAAGSFFLAAGLMVFTLLNDPLESPPAKPAP